MMETLNKAGLEAAGRAIYRTRGRRDDGWETLPQTMRGDYLVEAAVAIEAYLDEIRFSLIRQPAKVHPIRKRK